MSPPLPDETVRLLFEARNAGDRRRMAALLHRDAQDSFAIGTNGSRTEVHAHRIELDGDEVVAYGRVRHVDHGALVDSPAAWRFEVRDGVVWRVTPEQV